MVQYFLHKKTAFSDFRKFLHLEFKVKKLSVVYSLDDFFIKKNSEVVNFGAIGFIYRTYKS